MGCTYVKTFALVLAVLLFSECGKDSVKPEPQATDGEHLWSKRFGDADNQYAYGIATDAERNLIVVGSFLGIVNFGGRTPTSAGGEDIFVVKLGP